MGDSKSIINLGDLTKPVNTLIEKISNAIGVIYEPHQIVRVAQADAKAETIRVATQIEATELQRRAMRRFIMEEAKKQNNIEAIAGKALSEVGEQATPEKVEDDWIVNFFDKCRLISDEEMQSLWAKILAGEANAPGKFSKRTIDLLASMDKSDALLFSRLCSFVLKLGRIIPMIYDFRAKIYSDYGIHFESLCHLESIGLVQFDPGGSYANEGLLQKDLDLDYFGQQVYVGLSNRDNSSLRIGCAIFTKAGEQLAPVCSAVPQNGFIDYLKGTWKSLGYKIDREDIPLA